MIIGAGPAGLAVAIGLRRAGFEVAVYERAAAPKRAGNGLTLWPNGLAALDAIGAGDAVRAVARTCPGMAMRSSTGKLLYELDEPGMDDAGGNGVALHRADLTEALAGVLRELAGDVIHYGARCTGARTSGDSAVADFADGGHTTADLVVAADGINSAVRRSCGLGGDLRFAGFTVWRGTIAYDLPPTPGTMTMGGAGQFGIWNLPRERVYWFASMPSAQGVHRKGASRPPEEFASWHDPIPGLIAATPAEEISVTDIYDSAPLPAWSHGRVVLAGDAAHPSLPNMGQGTSQAFEDAAVLAACLTETSEITQALRTYERGRRARARAAWSQARLMARLGGWSSPPMCRLRELMLGAAPRSLQRRQLRRLFAFEQHGPRNPSGIDARPA